MNALDWLPVKDRVLPASEQHDLARSPGEGWLSLCQHAQLTITLILAMRTAMKSVSLHYCLRSLESL